MGWERKFLQRLAAECQKPCPECGGKEGLIKICPMDKKGRNMVGKVFSNDFMAYLDEELEAKGVLEKTESDKARWVEVNRRARRFREVLKKGRLKGFMDKNGRIKLGKGPHVVDCPKCKGKGFLETKESELLQCLSAGGTVAQAAAQRKYG
jgi:hypothetical protein